MRMVFVLMFLLYLPSAFSLSLGSLVSSALDFIPVVGNLKSLSEALTGKVIITGEDLSEAERALSFVGVIPGGNYLKKCKAFEKWTKVCKSSSKSKKSRKNEKCY